MSTNTLRADDLWPVVTKLPKTERLRLVDKLLQDSGSWSADELSNIGGWAAMMKPGDETLLDSAEGKPFNWKKR